MSEAWDKPANCADLPKDVMDEYFFPDREDGPKVAFAKRICLSCELFEPCLTIAVSDTALRGIFAATTTRERARMRSNSIPDQSA